MPTFLVFKNSSVAQTIRGADPNGLRTAVNRAASDAAKGPAKAGTAFQSKGYTLGSESQPSRTTGGPSFQMPNVELGAGFGTDVVRFIGLYFTSLLSLDAYRAAEQSPFAVTRR
jgi:thioredoxin 1